MSSFTTTHRDDDIAQQAAEWLARLSAEDSALADRLAFAAWQTADVRHAQAAQELEVLIGRLQALRSQVPTARSQRLLDQALARPARRRGARGIGVALLVLIGVLMPALFTVWPVAMRADLRSGTGEWQTHQLADHSEITLGSGSAVNVVFSAQERRIELLAGEVLVDVAADTARTFIVETPQGRIQALGTRFTVTRAGDVTVLKMLESKTWVQTAVQRGHAVGVEVRAGESLRFTAEQIGEISAIDVRGVADAWRFHQLTVRDQPLPEVLDALARHRQGFLRFDRAALAAYRVSAVLPLDDTDRALQLLTNALPVRVQMSTRWWVSVQADPRRILE